MFIDTYAGPKHDAFGSTEAAKSPAAAGTWIRDALPIRGVTGTAKNRNSACFYSTLRYISHLGI
jgi:hypothetical protein